MTTEEAIDNILCGHPEQFELIVSTHNQLLYRIGMSYINNHTEVEDLMQSTYMKAYEKLDSYRHQSAFSTWITRIMINECLMFLRSNRRKMEFSLDEESEKKNSEIPDKLTIEESLNYEELKDIAEKMVLRLPEEYRLVFMLREVQQLSNKEIARMLELTEENVKVRMFRARRMVQKMLLKYIGDADVFSYHKKYCGLLTQKVMTMILHNL
jgi:RNA polymerase sigma factor (sigma-70 family)